MLTTLWVLRHWENWESLAILLVPFQLYSLCFMSISMLILRFRGRIPLFVAYASMLVIAGWPSANVLWATLPYAHDYKDYRENLRQVREQERQQQKLAFNDVDKQLVRWVGGMAVFEAIKIMMATVPNWIEAQEQRKSARQLQEQAPVQSPTSPEAVGVEPAAAAAKAPENVSGTLRQ
ncbi:hypothetical protein GWQ44_29170 [Pseudomonas sp. 3MA1]|uniref:hypothetical protein n=1 Tax=Pseudomonas sp. 3MA1 TaxID=2699196 RepID=UPI0023DDE4CA|nr:hypothetical protein [Pseudomonas sp. 3MA1]MDF2399628.1 hypothetical protein [Pseudomonas sp. 3MA1]